MTDIKQFFTGAAADLIPRDRWGRPQIKQPDGKLKAYQRVTTFVGPLEDTSNLTKWKMRMALKGVMSRPSLQMEVASSLDDDRKLNAIAEKCLDAAGSSDKADLGSALHKFTENHDNGLDISAMPDAFKPDLAAYVQATSIFEMAAIEQFVVIDELAVAGTMDRIVKYNGRYYIADVKTGSIEYGMGKICMQLAAYAHGKGYDADTGQRIDLPPVSQTAGIIIHLPAGTGTCELIWCDLTAGWYACTQLAVGVQAWRKRKDLFKPFYAPAEVPGQTAMELPTAAPQAAPQAPQQANPLQQVIAQTHEAAAAASAAVAARPVAESLPPRNMPGSQAGFDNLAGEVSAALLQAIRGAIDENTLKVLWNHNQPVWSEEHTAAAKVRHGELMGGA
ncbi:hypothetical protein [Arthrobacter sp. HY1533]|uniref:hypothetical protein n=1 Tax=Arthrobacter sp. HY1533 TaxID=2970919 RepID=UPI0022B9DBD8|nr:hypothetical protein [Arthrobacter sp. HY1533]